ncbi:MAG: tRNA adenosine(34) deaminase TadA [Gammaproteobacteria bacterium]
MTEQSPIQDTDLAFMEEALALAAQAEQVGEVPVGAIVVHQGEIIARTFNQSIGRNDPSAHAEILALREAAQLIENYRLTGATMYVTLEPCAMCAGAMVHARLERLVYGCSDARAGAAGSVFDVVREPQLNHQLEVLGGVLEERARSALQEFFRARR